MFAIGPMSYRKKLLAFSLMLGIVPVLVLGTVSMNLFGRVLQKEVNLHQQSLLKQLQIQMDSSIGWMDQLSVSLSLNPTVQKIAERGLSMESLELSVQFMTELHNVVASSDMPIDISVVMPRHNAVYSHRAGMSRQLAYPDTELLKLHWTGSATSYKIPPRTFQGQNELLIVRPIPLNSSSPNGLLVFRLDTQRWGDAIVRSQLPPNRSLIIRDDEGREVVIGETWSDSRQEERTRDLKRMLPEAGAVPSRVELAGETFMLTSVTSSLNGWTYVVAASAREWSAQADNLRIVCWILVLCIALLWGAVAIFASGHMFAPLQRLAHKVLGRETGAAGTDLLAALDRSVQEMRQANSRMAHRLDEQRPIVEEHLLHRLLRGFGAPDGADDSVQTLLAKLRGTAFCVGVIEIDRYSQLRKQYDEANLALFLYALRKWTEESAEAHRTALTLSPQPGQVVFLMGFASPDGEADETARSFAISLCAEARRFFPFTVSVALSQTRTGSSAISASYQEAHALLAYRLALGESAIVLPEHVRDMDASLRDLIRMEREVVAALVQERYDEARERLSAFVGRASHRLQRTDAVAGLLVHLVGELDHSLQELGIELAEGIARDARRRTR
ncbi:hypothetical protein J31TS4_29910 [Paenibacillus sp. J31TS4]|uniref:cache domain-containing protein n=1 Tax=Paenibacillus sp. J31TS4 TaxID=2807195 RepID=UPI001B213E4F|nr:cache domain-containing protein [Paenibacillus sp. J31TS4]GIP39711.1 hypothetical protein J31TS4_29910 [Paenibacillus sp. J31TS4]